MDADWYEDPLGRYDGRFFDGDQWTAQVSANGSLQTDPDFPLTDDQLDQPQTFEASGASVAAVAPVDAKGPRRATTLAESPVRTVAVLDESLIAARSPTTPAATGDGRHRWRWFGLAALAALAALVILFVVGSGDDQPVAELDATEEERVADLESSGLSADQDVSQAEPLQAEAPAEPLLDDDSFDAADSVQVGSLNVLNGAPLLDDLQQWHRGYRSETGTTLGPDTGCWFGQLGDAAVQVVQCGPIGDDAEILFDLVPVFFEEAEGGRLARANIDDVVPDAVVANALTLVGHPDGVQPPAQFVTSRGERDQDSTN